MPLMIVGDEIYKAKAAAKAVKFAELLGMPVTQVRQLYANFPEAIRSGSAISPAATSTRCPIRRTSTSSSTSATSSSTTAPSPIVPRGPKFIDMRIDHWSMGNVMLTEVPLVADVGYGLDDLIAAVEQLMTRVAQAEGAPSAPRR